MRICLNDAIFKLGDYNKTNPQLADKATVLRAIDEYDLKTMRDISNFFYKTSGIYARILRYMAFMYRYDWYLTPYVNDTTIKKEKALLKPKRRAVQKNPQQRQLQVRALQRKKQSPSM